MAVRGEVREYCGIGDVEEQITFSIVDGDTPGTPLAVEPRLFAVLAAGPSTPEGRLLPVPAGQ